MTIPASVFNTGSDIQIPAVAVDAKSAAILGIFDFQLGLDRRSCAAGSRFYARALWVSQVWDSLAVNPLGTNAAA